ncbi:acyltransferase family protein [Frisingicoccus sp.]|uniref:acyltransferase family protein n=1 Tax=Frisingicoccus sp. TaxID=1918627 RepID=UPI003AB49B9A
MKSKKANFQLIKIIAMLMIVSHHLVAKNSFNIDTQVIGITANKVALQVLGNNAFIGNNLFFLVSAWFLSSKMDKDININYSIKSCWKIERTVSFYSYVLCIVVLALGGGQKCITPVHISDSNRNVVVSDNIHNFSYDLAFLPSGAS